MTDKLTVSGVFSCNFCGKSELEVQLLAGPGVYVCTECVDLMIWVLRNEMGCVLSDEFERTAHEEGSAGE